MQFLVMVDSARDVGAFEDALSELRPRVCHDTAWIGEVFEDGVPLQGASLYTVEAESAEAITAAFARAARSLGYESRGARFTVVDSRPTPSYPA